MRAQQQAHTGQSHALANHQGDDSIAVCTQGHAQGYLVPPLRNGKRHHSINPERGEQQRDDREAHK